MNQAYATGDPKRARRLLDCLSHKLESAHPGAAASLREDGRDPDSDGAAPIRDAGTGTVLDQPDRSWRSRDYTASEKMARAEP